PSSPDPFSDQPHYPYHAPPAPSAPPLSSRPSSASTAARWSFLNSPELDLSLSVYEPTSAYGSTGGGRGEGNWSPAGEDEEGRKKAGEEEMSSSSGSEQDHRKEREAPWTTPEVQQDGMAAKREREDEPTTSSAGGYLAPPSPAGNGLNRSTGSAPDSFVDPYMSSSALQPPAPSAPPPSATSPPAAVSNPPLNLAATPSPPRFDLAGRPHPSAPPVVPDPFGVMLAHQPPASPSRSSRARIGSLRGLTLPFGRAPHLADEDNTQSSFATQSSGTGGYWDTSLNISGVLDAPTQEHLARLQLQPQSSTPVRPGLGRSKTEPSFLGLLIPPRSPAAVSPATRPAHTVVDLPSPSTALPRPLSIIRPLPPLPPSSSAPQLSGAHVSIPVDSSDSAPAPPPAAAARGSIAFRRSVTRPPSIVLPALASPPPGSTAVTSSSGKTGTSGSSPLQITTRSRDGFYRLPVPPPSAASSSLPLPSPRLSTSAANRLSYISSSYSLAASPRSFSPLPSPHTAASDTFPLPPVPAPSTDSPTSAFPLPPATAAPSSAASAGTSHPLNPFRGHLRDGTGGSVVSSSAGGWASATEVTYGGTGGAGSGAGRSVPSFVSVFVPPGAARSSPYAGEADESDEEEDPFSPVSPPGGAVPIYPPRRLSHRAGVNSISSSVVDSPQRTMPGAAAVTRRFPALPEAEDSEEDQERRKREEKNRRTQAWLNGVSPGPSLPEAPPQTPASVTSSKATTGTGAGSRLRWAAAGAANAVGWSLRNDPLAAPSSPSSPRSARSRNRAERAKKAARKKGIKGWWARLSRWTRWAILAGTVVALLIIVGVAVGLGKKAASVAAMADCACENGGTVRATPEGGCACECKGEWGGGSCHLNATCVDAGGKAVAQGMLDVAQTASALFDPPVHLPAGDGSLALSLLAVPSLPFATYPSRLGWTESALLHTLALSESNSSLSILRTFASGLSFSQWGDEPASKPNSNYQSIVAGYTWDFAVLQRSVQNVGWAKTTSPDDVAQAAMMAAGEAQTALSNLTDNAVAASKQRTSALKHYWNDTLLLPAEQLDAFRAAVQSAEVVFPMDATASSAGGTAMDVAQAAKDAGTTFPPALGCRPGLSESVVAKVNEVESLWGLSAVQVGGSANASCTTRPLYGLLNLLRLRLPFPTSDTRLFLPQQSLVLRSSSTL
ncbi:hypothetical protein JCM10213_005054, partial [Rhodosporidiobolus nylandii]